MPSNNGATISRELAVKILNEADIGFFVESSIFKNLSDNKISAKDRSLTTEIVYGSIRWRDRLDSIIDKLLKYHSNRLNPEIRNILRVAIYQILFLNKIPVHAIVHQAVKQAGARLRGRFSGLVNAVIRSALRNPDILYFEPARNSKSLATYYSHPKWLIDRWLNKFGLEKTIKILETNNQRSCLTLRVNLLKINILELGSFFQEEGVDFEIIDHDRGVLRVNKTKGSVNSIPGFKEGFFVIQDFASQMIAPFLLAQPDHIILDICGAPGGKSSHVAALVNNKAKITLLDVDIQRLEQARKNFQRLGVNCAKMIHADATQKSSFFLLRKFDRILIDAPCSNLGVLRHNCEVKYRIKPDDLKKLSEKQLKILSEASVAVKNHGIMIYCVCSTSDEETTEVVKKFLNQNKNFSVHKIERHEVPNPDFLTSEGYFFSFPSNKSNAVDGFFAARMQKMK